MAQSMYDEKQIEKSFDSNIIRRLLKYARPQWLSITVTIVLMIIVTGIDLAVPYVTKLAVDNYIIPTEIVMIPAESNSENTLLIEDKQYRLPHFYEQSSKFSDTQTIIFESSQYYQKTEKGNTVLKASESNILDQSRADELRLLILALALVFIINFAFTFLHTYLLNYASQKVIYKLREDLFSHILSMRLSFFDKNPVGRLVTRVSNDMNNINEMFTDVLVTSLKDILLLSGTVVVMFSINVKLALVGISLLPIVVVAAMIFRKVARDVQRDVKVKIARINATLSENISGMKIIQIFNKEREIYKEFKSINKDHLSSSVQETKVYATFRPVMNLAYSTSVALLLWFGGGDAIQGLVPLGVLIAFLSYIQQFYQPIMDLSEKFNIFQSSMASAERVFMILDESEVIEDSALPSPIENSGFKGEISFKNVWFTYSPEIDNNYVLKDISFDIKPGETIALVGATGSGKTTITSLLSRFYDIQKGCISIDGIDIKDYNKEALRSQIGIVLQDVFLFAGDIESNIRLYEDGIPSEKIKSVSKFVNADSFIQQLPNGYKSSVTERGSTLSSGQRQLLSFARALAFDPKILVLDEATSNIDTETEKLIQDAISKIIQNRTTIIVAHRLSTIQHADKIIVMHKGEIRETGTHQELLIKGGMYYDLYRLQYQE